MLRPILCLPLLATTLLLRADSNEKQLRQAASLTLQGHEFLAKGDLLQARTCFEKALGVVPNFPDALLGMGHLHMKEGRFQEALGCYQQARDIYPQIGRNIYQLRIRSYDGIQKQIANYQTAITSLKGQMASSKSDTTALERQVVQMQEAMRKLQVVQPPTEATATEAPGEVHYHIGNAHFRLNHFKEATEDWEICATKTPDFPTVKVNLCVAYWKLGRFGDAKQQLQRAESLGFPVNPKMKEDLAKAEAAAAKP